MYKGERGSSNYILHLMNKDTEYFLSDILPSEEIHKSVCDTLSLDPTKTAVITLHKKTEGNDYNTAIGATKQIDNDYFLYNEFTLSGTNPIKEEIQSYLDYYEINYSLKDAWVAGNVDKEGNLFYYTHDIITKDRYKLLNIKYDNGYDIIFNILVLHLPEMDLATKTLLLFNSTSPDYQIILPTENE